MPETIIDLIENVAQAYPNRILIETDKLSLTAENLSIQSSILAKGLHCIGITCGTVAILSENSINHYLILGAAAKAGLAYVSLRNACPISSMVNAISKLRIKLLAFQPKYTLEAMELKRANPGLILVCLDREIVADEDGSSKRVMRAVLDSKIAMSFQRMLIPSPAMQAVTLPQVTPSMLALLAFTSGTTSANLPKAVMLSHENVLYMTASSTLSKEESKVVPSGSWTWLGCAWDIFNYLASGKTVVLSSSSNSIKSNLEYLPDVILVNGEELNALASLPQEEINKLKQKATVIAYSGESMPRKLILKAINALCPEISLVQIYAATETLLSGCKLRPEDHNMVLTAPTEINIRRLDSVGKPDRGVQVKVINDYDVECQPNEIGDVVIRTNSLVPGYYNDRESTSKLFRNGWIDVGDRGYFDEDGYLYLVGRRNQNEIFAGSARINNVRELQSIVEDIDGVDRALVGVAAINETEYVKLFYTIEEKNDNCTEKIINKVKKFLDEFTHSGVEPILLKSFPRSKMGGKILIRVLIKDLEDGVDIGKIDYSKLNN